jgi:hypothetical protein
MNRSPRDRLLPVGRPRPRCLRDFYQQREQTRAQAMADRHKWEHATE